VQGKTDSTAHSPSTRYE